MNTNKIFLLLSILLTNSNANAQSESSRADVNNIPLVACCVPWMGLDLANEFSRGPDCELFEEFAKYLGRQAKVKIVQWPDLFVKGEEKSTKLFDSKDCDLYSSNIGMSEERIKILDIVPYYSSRSLVVVHKENDFRPKSPDNLRGRKTAVVPGTIFEKWVLEFNSKQKKEKDRIKYLSIPRGGSVKLLEKREIDFALMDSGQAMFESSRPNSALEWAIPVGSHSATGWAFPKQSKSLQEKFREFVETQKTQKESALTRVYLKYYRMTFSEFESVSMSVQ